MQLPKRVHVLASLVAAVFIEAGVGCGPTCVIKDNVCVPRPTLRFTGRYYAINHYQAYPGAGGPSEGLEADGGRIAGVVCGVDIEFLVRHEISHVAINGFLDNRTAQLAIAEKMGIRLITGSIGGKGVDLQLYGDRIEGRVGRAPISMGLDRSDGDTLVQVVQKRDLTMRLRFRGIDVLWSMPAAAQAAIVPIMADCMVRTVFASTSSDPEPFRFGGPPISAPPDLLRFR